MTCIRRKKKQRTGMIRAMAHKDVLHNAQAQPGPTAGPRVLHGLVSIGAQIQKDLVDLCGASKNPAPGAPARYLEEFVPFCRASCFAVI